VFLQQKTLQPLFESIARSAVEAVKVGCSNVFGQKTNGNYQDELGKISTPVSWAPELSIIWGLCR